MKSLKIRLELNNKQKTFALQHCGVARHAWNWGLTICKEILDKQERILSAFELQNKLVAEVKRVNKWYYDVSKYAPAESIRNLETAFKRCFKKTSKFPKYKKKGQRDSFYNAGKINIEGNKIKIPKFGWVKMSQSIDPMIAKSCTISRTADEWFVSFQVPFEPQETIKTNDVVGVDLGIKTLATLSDGQTFANRRPFKTYKRKLKLAQRQQSKKYVKSNVKGKEQSQNYKKASLKVAKLHQKIAYIRKDALHKLTSHLSKNHAEIVIEDLNVRGMSKNHKLASAILDGGFYEFRRQLEYKCKWYGSKLTIVNRFYPSSKTCSNCQHIKKDLKLKDRIYKCSECGHKQDRDLNAAINLKSKVVGYTASACGALNKRCDLFAKDAMKQEMNSNLKVA